MTLYFDERLGEGHPVDWSGDFVQNSVQTERSKGTYTYRLVLLRPVRQERTQRVEVC